MTRPEPMSHEEAALLLPWLVNGTLGEREEQRLRAHSDVCLACRREVGRLETLERALARSSAAMPVPEADLRAINRRIDERLARGRGWLRRVMRLVDWIERNPWRAVAAVQALLIVALIPVLVEDGREEPVFETLTSEPAALSGDFVRVAFAPALDRPDVAALLQSLGLVAAAGPSPRNVYTVECAETDCDAAAARLRARPDVLFAEAASGRGN